MEHTEKRMVISRHDPRFINSALEMIQRVEEEHGVAFSHWLHASSESLTKTQIAKELGVTLPYFNAFLRSFGFSLQSRKTDSRVSVTTPIEAFGVSWQLRKWAEKLDVVPSQLNKAFQESNLTFEAFLSHEYEVYRIEDLIQGDTESEQVTLFSVWSHKYFKPRTTGYWNGIVQPVKALLDATLQQPHAA